MIKDLIDLGELTKEEWDDLFRLGMDIKKNPAQYSSACRGKIMTTLFYEPSTRTQLSHRSAMLHLGGEVIGFSDPGRSSVSKGETLRDTIKMVAGYGDITVIRHPLEGAALASAIYSKVPVINAGDGGHLHPTQTMADLCTIGEYFGGYSGLSIGACGDLKNGRTVHSLCKSFAKYTGNTFYFISTESLSMPDSLIDILKESGNNVYCVKTIEECIDNLDVLYMTRIQKERFSSAEEYEKEKGVYILDRDKLNRAKKDMIIMHPLPKVDEIAYDIDDDPRARYFIQAENGMYMRMALIIKMLEGGNKKNLEKYEIPSTRICRNPLCITAHEKYLPTLTSYSDGKKVCAFCEKEILI